LLNVTTFAITVSSRNTIALQPDEISGPCREETVTEDCRIKLLKTSYTHVSRWELDSWKTDA